jgi:hypothetical protein
MGEAQFYASINMLREDVVSRGAAIDVVECAPASTSAITECSTRLGVRLPDELVSFLSRRNGLSVSYYEDASVAATMPDAWSERFEVHGTTGITQLTLGLRGFFVDVAAGSPRLAKMCQRIDGMIILASESDLVTYVRVDDPMTTTETCPVREFDQERYGDWLTTPERPIVAPSIADHVLRSIQSMINTKETFMYWTGVH